MPADHAALAVAVETLRDYWRHTPVNREQYTDACELIAHHFLALLDAGELVRKVECDLCGDGVFASSECSLCDGNGYIVKPLLPEVRT